MMLVVLVFVLAAAVAMMMVMHMLVIIVMVMVVMMVFMLLLVLAAAIAMMMVMLMFLVVIIVVMVVMVFMLLLILAAAVTVMVVMLVFFMAVGGGALCVPGGDLGVRLAVPGDFQKLRDECVRVGGGEPQLLCGEGDGNLLHAGDLGELLLDLGGAVGAVDTRDDIYLLHGVSLLK